MSYDVLKLTKRLIEIDSTNPGKYEGEMLSFISNFFENVKTESLNIYTEEVEPNRSNYMITLPGDVNNPELVLICHMDTVTIGEGWTKKPFFAEVTENAIYGRGSCDMKSGMACAMSGFVYALKNTCGKNKRTLKFIATVDEEGDMNGVEKVISSGWVNKNSLVLDLEPTNGQIRVSHKGRLWFSIKIYGITAHASTPWKGADAIAAMSEVIYEIRKNFENMKEDSELGKPTVTFGMIKGGYQPYVVPDYCELTIDMRLVPPYDTYYAENLVKNTIEKVQNKIKGISGYYTINGDRPYIKKDRSSTLLDHICKAVNAITGKKADIGVFSGYTDTAVIAGKLKNINCMSYGPGNLEQAHKPDEFVKIQDIFRCEKVIKKLIDDIVL